MVLAKTSRIFELDVLRGIAIIMMVLFHFGYDLSFFGYADYDTNNDIEWRIFRYVIVTSFLLAVGMSSYAAYFQSIKLKKLLKAVFKLVAVAGLITFSSMYMHPQEWIYFGIIHFIALALLFSVLFVRTPLIALVLGIAIIILSSLGILSVKPIYQAAQPFLNLPEHTVDLVQFVPWFGVVLIGIYLMSKNLYQLNFQQNRFTDSCAVLGRHSLIIYLVHQPILFAGFYTVQYIHALGM